MFECKQENFVLQFNEPHQWTMQYIKMVILPHEKCVEATNGLSTENHICAVTEFGEGTCKVRKMDYS